MAINEFKIVVEGKVTFLRGIDGDMEDKNERSATIVVEFRSENSMDDYQNRNEGGIVQLLQEVFEHVQTSIKEELEFLPPLESTWHFGAKINQP